MLSTPALALRIDAQTPPIGPRRSDHNHLDAHTPTWSGVYPSGKPVGELLFDDVAHVKWRILLQASDLDVPM